MITMTESLIIIYSLVIFLFFNVSSNFFFWILLECNMIVFICLLFYMNKFYNKMELYDFSLYYFIVQSLGSLIFLMSSCFSSFYSLGGMMIMTILSLILKTALFPFSFWLFSSLNSLTSLSLALLISIQKIPLYVFIFLLNSHFIMLFLFFSFVFGSYYLFHSSNWSNLIFSSSIYSCLWIYLIFNLSFLSFSYFFFIYTFFVFTFCDVYSISFFHSVVDSVTCGLSFLFFLGLPPLSMFFLKFYLLNFCFNFFPIFFFFIIWIFIFFSLFGYLKFMYSFFLPSFNFFKNFNFSTLKFLSLILGSGFFPIIFFFSSKLF